MKHNSSKFEVLVLMFEESVEKEWIKGSLDLNSICDEKTWEFYLVLSSLWASMMMWLPQANRKQAATDRLH